MLETYEDALGAYEQKVLLCLTEALTNEEAQPLVRGAVALILIEIIEYYHDNGELVADCTAALMKLRLLLFQDVSLLDAIAAMNLPFEPTAYPRGNYAHDEPLQYNLFTE